MRLDVVDYSNHIVVQALRVNLWNWIEVGQLKNIPHVSSQGVSVVMMV